MSKHIVWAGFGLIVLSLVGLYAVSVASAELAASLRFLIQIAALVGAAGLLIGLASFGWIAAERARLATEKRLEARAQRSRAEAEARQVEREANLAITIAPPGCQVFAHEAGGSFVHRPLHLAPARLNGLESVPDLAEVQRWALFHLAHSAGGPAGQLPDPSLPALAAGGAGLAELPKLVRWFELVPHHRGDLDRLVLGLRAGEAGRLAPVTISLYDLFHTIVAASSGWGKSVFASAILAQLATCAQPVEFVLIDQQEHGLAAFKSCDRLRYPLLREPGEILSALREVYGEAVKRRSELFARYDADDLEEYNRRAGDFLAPVVVAVDEASALLAGEKEIGAELKRQAWELRKFGVYQILCLTSAKGTTIDTDHRQQFSSKIQMHANDRYQARLLLDAPEAVAFPAGRAVIDLPGQPPAVVQTPYITKAEVRSLLRPASTPPAAPAALAPEPDEIEARILALAGQGQSKSAIARAVLGDDGGNQLKRVSAVLDRFGVP